MKNEQVSKAKEQAFRVTARLGEMGIEVKHSQALEVIAAVFGAENWHAYAAQLKKPQAASDVLTSAEEKPRLYMWVQVRLVAGMGDFRTEDVFLAEGIDDAVAKAKAKHWTAEVAARYPEGCSSGSLLIAGMSTLEDIEQWLVDCDIDAEDLDESVHDAMQEGRLDELNALDGEDDQENHISRVEREASNINNSGLSAQLAFLFQGYENDIPGFVSWLQDVLDLHDWYPNK